VNENDAITAIAVTIGTAWTTVRVTAAILRHRATMRRESARAGGA
jgi:hypothetical protein